MLNLSKCAQPVEVHRGLCEAFTNARRLEELQLDGTGCPDCGSN
jgi:hypothetical protein